VSVIGTAWDGIETMLQDALLWFDDVVSSVPLIDGWSWGVAVVLLTLACRLVLSPTLIVQLRFLRRMDEVAGELEVVKQRNRVDLKTVTSNPVRAAATWVRSEEEQDLVLKKHGVRWYVGLLPALVQIPAVVAVLRVLADEDRTRDLTPATWAFVPPPTTSFLHSDQGRPFLAVLGMLTVALVHLGQRRSVAASQHPLSPTLRSLRLLLLPLLAGLLVLNLALAIVVSLLTSLLWGLGQSLLLARRRGHNPVPVGVAS